MKCKCGSKLIFIETNYTNKKHSVCPKIVFDLLVLHDELKSINQKIEGIKKTTYYGD